MLLLRRCYRQWFLRPWLRVKYLLRLAASPVQLELDPALLRVELLRLVLGVLAQAPAEPQVLVVLRELVLPERVPLPEQRQRPVQLELSQPP